MPVLLRCACECDCRDLTRWRADWLTRCFSPVFLEGLRAAEAAAEARARGEEVRGMYTEPVRDGTGNEKVEELEGEVARLTALNRKLKDEREGELDRVQKQLQSEIDKCQTDLVNSQAEASQLRANVSSEQASGKRMRDEIDIHKFAVEADKKLVSTRAHCILSLLSTLTSAPCAFPDQGAGRSHLSAAARGQEQACASSRDECHQLPLQQGGP